MSTFWFIVPSLPLFIALPVLIRSEIGFLAQHGDCRRRHAGALRGWFWAAPRLGIKL